MKVYINETDYSLMSVYNFFGGSDIIRIVILIYILLSFLLNTLNFTFVAITQHKKKKKISLGTLVTCALLLVNFIHTSAYLFEWVIKKGNVQTIIVKNEKNGKTGEVGGLLTGNPSHFFFCYSQAFILISSSISQDFIINIFFYMVISPKEELRQILLKVLLLILGILFPIGFTLMYYFIGALGINDQFCYAKKFDFEINDGYINYFLYDKFQLYVMIIYGIRVFNFFFTFFFLIKIIIYVRREKMSKAYIFKSIIIPIIQLFTIFIGVTYRSLNIYSLEVSAKFSSAYLILNTVDGVLFPLIFLFQHKIVSNLRIYVSQDVLDISNDNNDNKILEDNASDYEDDSDN